MFITAMIFFPSNSILISNLLRASLDSCTLCVYYFLNFTAEFLLFRVAVANFLPLGGTIAKLHQIYILFSIVLFRIN